MHGWGNSAAMPGELSKSKAKEYVLNMERHGNAAAAATSGATSIALAKESAQNIEVEEKWQGNAAAMLGWCNKRTIRKESALNRGGKIPMRMKPWRSSKKVRKLSPYPHRGVFTFQVSPWLFPPLFYLKLCFLVSSVPITHLLAVRALWLFYPYVSHWCHSIYFTFVKRPLFYLTCSSCMPHRPFSRFWHQHLFTFVLPHLFGSHFSFTLLVTDTHL